METKPNNNQSVAQLIQIAYHDLTPEDRDIMLTQDQMYKCLPPKERKTMQLTARNIWNGATAQKTPNTNNPQLKYVIGLHGSGKSSIVKKYHDNSNFVTLSLSSSVKRINNVLAHAALKNKYNVLIEAPVSEVVNKNKLHTDFIKKISGFKEMGYSIEVMIPVVPLKMRKINQEFQQEQKINQKLLNPNQAEECYKENKTTLRDIHDLVMLPNLLEKEEINTRIINPLNSTIVNNIKTELYRELNNFEIPQAGKMRLQTNQYRKVSQSIVSNNIQNNHKTRA